jgi:hypothetical protein
MFIINFFALQATGSSQCGITVVLLRCAEMQSVLTVLHVAYESLTIDTMQHLMSHPSLPVTGCVVLDESGRSGLRPISDHWLILVPVCRSHEFSWVLEMALTCRYPFATLHYCYESYIPARVVLMSLRVCVEDGPCVVAVDDRWRSCEGFTSDSRVGPTENVIALHARDVTLVAWDGCILG